MNQLNAEAMTRPGMAALPDTPTPAAGSSLQHELDKWRERVPRLLAALRERSEEVDRLQRELAELRDPAPVRPGFAGPLAEAEQLPGMRAREELIDELERELAALRDLHATAQGDLHARSLTISGLKRDLQGWKEKWQDLARRLDGAASSGASDGGRIAELGALNGRLTQELADLRRSLAEFAEERDALKARNANLFETTGFANRQMEVLADDLAELRGQLKSLRGKHEAVVGELEALRQERESTLLAAQDARAEAEVLEGLLHALQAPAMALGADRSAADRLANERLADLESERAALREALAQSAARADSLESALQAARQAQAGAEQALAAAERMRQRAESACQGAEAACEAAERTRGLAETDRDRAEGELREAREARLRLQQQADQLAVRQHQLEHQLEERSALVRGLEQELIGRDLRLDQLESERNELESGLARTTRNTRENADYVQQLDHRLERQKELLLSLEQELAGAQENQAAAARRHEAELSARDAEIRALRLQIVGLQSLLQEPDAAAPDGAQGGNGSGQRASASDSPGMDATAEDDPVRAARDSRSLRILNQQLRDARARNQAQLERIRELEARALVGAEAQVGDDLTRIRGVGPRLAQHLRELGVSSFSQIAELDSGALSDPSHALAALRSRILRDGWIEQAAGLQRP